MAVHGGGALTIQLEKSGHLPVHRTIQVPWQRHVTVPDVVSTLELLRRTHRMAMVTTAYREDVELIHRDRSILPFFEFVVAYEDYARAKPDPEPYLQALTRFGVTDLSEAIAIEDSSRGLAAAVAAGIDCVVVRNEFTAAQDFSKAWRIVDSVRELPDLLESRIT